MRSRLFEDEITLAYHDRTKYANHFVDIGAGDGSTWSNSLLLAENGWSGVCFEINQAKIDKLVEVHRNRPQVVCIDMKVTAGNIAEVIRRGTPKNLGLLSVDIDGVDAYVIDAVLKEFMPQIVIAEHNHMVPPPVRFCVNYDPDWIWGRNHFFGASLDHLCDVIIHQGYGLTHVMGGNAIFMRDMPSAGTTEQLWRASHIPFIRITNEADSITLGTASPVDMPLDRRLAYTHSLFSEFTGKYRASIEPL